MFAEEGKTYEWLTMSDCFEARTGNLNLLEIQMDLLFTDI